MPQTFCTTDTRGVYIAHQAKCGAPARRCRCKPVYRGKGWDRVAQKSVWSPSTHDRSEVLNWLSLHEKAQPSRIALAQAGPSFKQLALEWWNLVEGGKIEKRRGRKSKGYTATTIRGYRQSLFTDLIPEFGALPAATIAPVEWQRWVDRLSREGKSRSRILNHLAVIRGIYAYACRPTRQLVAVNPTIGLALPPNDEKPRDRVAPYPEAKRLLDTLVDGGKLELAVPYAIAMFAGLRRAEIDRLRWEDILWKEERLIVRVAKSEAGELRRPPVASPLVTILRQENLRQGRPKTGRILTRSVFSGTLSDAARKAWGWKQDPDRTWVRERDDALNPITLHEGRHTYASTLMAARYTLTEIMEYMGHKDLSATQRYLKRLPQPQEASPAGRLNDYLDAFQEGS